MDSPRLLQFIEETSKRYLKEKGRLPNKAELDELIRKTNQYSPFSKPKVPLNKALSNAEYVTDTLKSLMRDSNSVTELITKLEDKAIRINDANTKELKNIQLKVAKLLELYKNDYQKLIYSEKPGTPQNGSNNVSHGREGIQLKPSVSALVDHTFNVVSYTEGTGNVNLQTISTDPLKIVATGGDSLNKGVVLNFNITDIDKFVSSITIESSPITAEVTVNGAVLVTKDIIDIESFIIGQEIETLSIKLYSNAPQVLIDATSIELKNSLFQSGAGYETGVYISPAITIGKEDGKVIVNPSTYIPDNGGIVWYYSTDYTTSGGTGTWHLIEKDENDITHLQWNSIDKGATLDQIASLDSNRATIFTITDEVYNGVNVKSGKDSILFIGDKENSIYKFRTHIIVGEDGYTIEIDNPLLSTGDRFIKNISISSDTFNYNESTADLEVITKDITEGTHLVEIETVASEAYENMNNFTDISTKIGTHFGIDFNVRSLFNNDYLGRSVNISIVPTALVEEDYSLIAFNRPKDRFNKFTIQPDHKVDVENWSSSSDMYDVILNNDIYKVGATYTAVREQQTYAGAGESWDFPTNQEPIGLIVSYGSSGECFGATGAGNTASDGSCIGFTGTMLVQDTGVQDYDESFYYKESEPVYVFNINYEMMSGTTATLGASSYNVDETWDYDTTGATFTLARVPDGSTATVKNASGVTQSSVYFAPGSSGEDGGNIAVSSPAAGATYTVYYNSTPDIREQDLTSVTIANLPFFPFGYNTVRHTETLETNTLLGESGGSAHPDNLFLTYNVDSVHDMYYFDGEGATQTLNLGGAADVSGATGGDLIAINNQMITVDTKLLSQSQPLTIEYNTFDLSQGYPFTLTYDYYHPTPYYFTYTYEVSDYVLGADIYGNTGMLNHFYDISYYSPENNNDTVYLKAIMRGNSKETPIIRRIRLINE